MNKDEGSKTTNNMLSAMVSDILTKVEFNPSKDNLSELQVILEKALPKME